MSSRNIEPVERLWPG